MSLVDLARPLRCVHPARRSIVLTFPRPMLPFRGSELEPLVGARIPGDTGAAALTSTLVRQLPRHLDEDAAVGARLGTAVVDLLAVALAARIERSASLPADARARALLVRIHAFIEGRLSDPELTPAAVAAAHHISRRYLHRLFEHQQHSVAGVIRQRRLDRCRADLTNPATAGRPVAAIAARWGFGNAAHFNRIFRDTYGLPPGEYRHRFTSASA